MKDFPIPKILQCNHFIAHSSSHDTRYVRDYEFDFYMDGERDMYIDGRYHKISKGCLVFRKPGQVVIGSGDYNMFILTLDFSKEQKISQDKYFRSDITPLQKKCEFDIFQDIPEVFFPTHQEEILELYKVMSKYSYPNIVNEEMQQKAVTEFLLLVLSDAYKHNRETVDMGYNNTSYVKRACNYINRNYAKDISVGDIADYLSLNKNYFIKLFKKELSQTPNQYILETRLFYAKLMLIQTDVAVGEIALLCGFNTVSYFIKCFRMKFGKSPLVYRNTYLSAQKS